MTSPTGRERGVLAALGVGLVLAVFLVYWPVRAHGFVSYDDEVYLTNNPYVARGLDWGAIRWLFTHVHAANYHPLTWVSHMLDVELFGFEAGGHHLMSVVLHALNAVLVLLLARAVLGDAVLAGLAAALFALHPLRVESVAWASERKDVLCALFFLAGLLCYLRYARRRSAGAYLAVCLALALALLSKPMAVTFPCVALLLDAWPLRRLGTRGVLLEKLPLFALAALGAASTWLAQEVGGAVSGARAVPLDLRVLNALAAYGAYLRETFWPVGLAAFHPLAAVVEEHPRRALLVPALVSALALGAVTLAAWRGRGTRAWVVVGWLWFLGTLVPAIGLKQVGQQAHADRYTYLPLIGIVWIVAGCAGELVRRRPALRVPAAVAGAGVLLALALAARRQTAVWKDTFTLFTHALEVTEKNHVAHAALGTYHADRGEAELARGHLEAALALYPFDATALASLARLAREAGDLDAAERYLARALQVHASKGVRYQLGLLRLARGEREAAARELAAAVELDASFVDARFNLGQVLFALGQVEGARGQFEAAAALDPEHAGAQNGLGVLALQQGDAHGAERFFRHAVELDPAYADAANNLGVALERLGRMDEARRWYAEARRLREPRPQ